MEMSLTASYHDKKKGIKLYVVVLSLLASSASLFLFASFRFSLSYLFRFCCSEIAVIFFSHVFINSALYKCDGK